MGNEGRFIMFIVSAAYCGYGKRCDGITDCHDGSDEENCGGKYDIIISKSKTVE